MKRSSTKDLNHAVATSQGAVHKMSLMLWWKSFTSDVGVLNQTIIERVHSGQVGEERPRLVFVQIVFVHSLGEWQQRGDETQAAGSAQDGPQSVAQAVVCAASEGCMPWKDSFIHFMRQVEYAPSARFQIDFPQ